MHQYVKREKLWRLLTEPLLRKQEDIMRKFRKKPIIIEAEQWFGYGDVPEAKIIKNPNYPDHSICNGCGYPLKYHGLCPTLEGNHIICPGDWIIKGIKGEFYPCKPDIFEMTYEPIKEDI